ncbi:nonribosomal siderophore peptide synthase [Lecanosticta acicola]|uniref:Nonribosomal siderophore peptide synthase n=1 Tax=Lecanosticta acicola TaxID=111012 RepID=A0AAI8YX06_9PEZI|nr:nonribosomal siderophore peptide synthase [Lecanosticta acicola]
MSNSAAFYVSWLSVLKAGFAFCPLPVDAPPEQLHTIVEEVGASLVLTNGPQVGGRPWDAWYCDDDELATCLDVQNFIREFKEGQLESTKPLPVVEESSLAYVMYTSGSTGKPKGVKISHFAAACSIASHSKFIPTSFFKEGFRWFQFAAPTFDPSIMEIFTTWWTGGTLCGAPRDLLLTDPEDAINQLSATIMMATPSMASVLRPEKVPTLRHLWTMGEKLTAKVIQNFASDSPSNTRGETHTPSLQRSRKLLNAYGPTEGSINCTIVPDVSVDERGSIIGQAIDTCSILILDPSCRRPIPVPLGFSGELAIGGPQVSQGYLNRPDQTAASFVTCQEYGRLYRTGDRARIVKTKQGELTVEYLGRMTSDQVKLSGRRVELGQIESVLAGTDGVTDAVAIVHHHGQLGHGSEQVVVCLIIDQNKSAEDILVQCRKSAERLLPAFMRPSRYFVLESMPRSRSGKTDRKALTAIVEERWQTADVSEASSDSGYDSELARSISDDATYALVIKAIAEVCEIKEENMSPGTNLLSLGLDSLRAVRLLQQLRDKGISSLAVATVLSSRTVQGLANACAGTDCATPKGSPQRYEDWPSRFSDFDELHRTACAKQLGLDAAGIEKILPTTATQSGMVASFLRSVSKQVASGPRKSYINHSLYYQKTAMDSTRLGESWRAVLARHDSFRMVFVPVDDELSPFAQCVLSSVAESASSCIEYLDCRSLDDWNETVQNAQADAEASITLDKPPFRLSVIRAPDRTAYLLSLFHGIFDGGSLELFLEDVEGFYYNRPTALRTGIESAVLTHFAEATDDTVKYWNSEFEAFQPVPFPCVSASKPETQSQDAQVAEFIGRTTLERLSVASKAACVSPLSILQAAWATILFAYTGSTTEVSFGSVVSDRLEEDLSSCVGPTFVVVPSKIRQQQGTRNTVKEVLSLLTAKNADALPHHHIRLSSLTTAEGTLPYDTLLAFQAFDKSAADSDLWRNVEYPAMEHDFAIMIEIWPTQTGPIRFRGTYTHKHLEYTAAEAMLQQMDDVVCYLCDNLDEQFLDSRFAVSSHLQSQIPVAVKQGEFEANSQQYLHQAFLNHVRKSPEDLALLFKQSVDGTLPDVKWTYGTLHDLARDFAVGLLQQFGSVTNEPIMICMEKCPELYIAVLGILLAGAGWCPIDPYSPPARQHAIMKRTGSRLLVVSPTSSHIDSTAIPAGVTTVALDLEAIEAGISESKQLEVAVERHPSDLAYLIFTSGTTGLPKGVPITHSAGATAMNALAAAVPSDVAGGVVRCMQFSQYTFDVFVQDLFYTWTLGGAVISSTRQLMIQNFADLANQTRATHAHLTPAFSATLPRDKIETLEVVTMIGEKLTDAVAQDWGTNLRAFNTYGPAEVTVVSTLRQFTGKTDTHHSSNVGVPLPSVGTYVVEDDSVVMRGALGELALAGPQVSSGYWNLPEVNAKKFVWNDKLQQRLYLTGDLVRHLADGTINFVGRNDDLVKLGGIRVELGEIAFALKDADPRIEKFEVLHCKRKDADEKLVVAFMACPSLAEGMREVEAILNPTAKELAGIAREYGRTVLPPYMLPTTFIVLPRIPHTASAKVDRAALTTIYHGLDLSQWEAPENISASNSNAGDREWREANAKLLQIVSETLKISPDSVRATSSLPAIGIDSIAAIRLVPKINALGANLSVVDAFKCRTLSDLAELAKLGKTSSMEEPVQAVTSPSDAVLHDFDGCWYDAAAKYLNQEDITVIPTTILQESLLSESFKDPQAYWSSHLFQLKPDVDTARLKRAWTKVTRQTEALRVGFVAKAMLSTSGDVGEDGLSYLQVVYDEPYVQWTEHDNIGALTEAARSRVAEIAQQHHHQLFKFPPWAIDIFRQEDGTSIAMLTIHHTIYDGPSLGFLEADLKAQYLRTFQAPQRLQLTEAVLSGSALDADSSDCIEFWKTALEDFEADSGEQDLTEQGVSKLSHRIQYLRSSTPMTKLRDAARSLGLNSVVTILRTAWALILTDLLESPRVLFAEVLSHRIADHRLANVVGPMMSTVPSLFKRLETVRSTLMEQDSFSKAAWQHRNVRPGTIRSLLKRDNSSQVYPAMFAFHPSVVNGVEENCDLWQRMEDATTLQAEHPLAFNVWQDAEPEPYFELAIAEHIMNSDEQNLLLRQLDALVLALVREPKQKLAALTDGCSTDLISRTTPRKDTKCPPPCGPTYWVENWAETHPEWKAAEIALKIEPDGTETECWTYAQLNAESNRIAHWIIQQGVVRSMIGMCLGRTLISYAVILGILKSGNCYLSIDESLPAERKAFLLEDSTSRFIFTSPGFMDDVELASVCVMVDVEHPDTQAQFLEMGSNNPSVETQPRDNCYLLYTSGSTGKPKGVLVNRENLASFCEAQAEFIYSVTTTAETAGRGKYLGLASRAFDVHLGEMFLAWRFGLAAITAPRSMFLDDLALALSSLHITHASFVPSLLDQTGLTPEDAPDLVFIATGGEKMSSKTKKLWSTHHRVRLINAYGPTEATIGLNSSLVTPDTDTRDIGTPLGDSQGHVLVPGTENYVLRGMPGELCFTGSLIANGYLNRPDAKGFVEDFHGKRMYRTGDIVKLGLDDHVYFLGRKDDQVKIRGQRVELGEVAEGVRTASDVDINVAALVVQHPGISRMQLVAFIAAGNSTKERSSEPPEVMFSELHKTSSDLRAKCQKILPSSTVPDLIIQLTYMPLAATSGKADNKLLIKIFSTIPINELMPNSDSGGGGITAVARPMNEAEMAVLEIVSSALKVKEPQRNVTPASTLFELGIDSLSGISVFSKLRAAGYDCSVAMVMKNPTLEQLAKVQKQNESKVQHSGNHQEQFPDLQQMLLQSGELPVPTEHVAAIRPCLPLQEVLVAQSIHESPEGVDGAYVNHICFELPKDVDIDRLRHSWQKVMHDNEVLRTCFATSLDNFFQVVLKPQVCETSWTTLAPGSFQDIEDLKKVVAKEVVQSVSTRSPIRLHEAKCSSGSQQLLLSIHHALYDGMSLEMMIYDVEENYKGSVPETRPSVTPLIEYIARQDKERQKAHWTNLLAGWNNAPLLSDVASKNVQLATCERQFNFKLSEIDVAASATKATTATVLQAAFAMAMAQTLKTNDFIFGNVLSGRTIPVKRADQIMAPCITTVPQRLKLTDDAASITEIIRLLQDSNSSSLEHQHVSPRDIQKWTKADRALYDCLFSFIRLQPQADAKDRVLKEVDSTIGVDYPLAIEFEVDSSTDQLIVRAGFTETFGTSSDAELLLEKIEMLTDAIVRQPDMKVSSLGCSNADSRRSVAQTSTYDESRWSDFEQRIRELVSKFVSLPEKDVGKNTAFIHLGVDSISAIRLAKQLRSHGLKVSSADIIRHNRLGALCQHLSANSQEAVPSITPLASRDTRHQQDLVSILESQGFSKLGSNVECYECTPLQAGMLAQSLATGGALYMHHHATYLAPNVDSARLRVAWSSLVADLDILRTTFHWLPKHKAPWVAVVHPQERPDWKEVHVPNARQYWSQLSNSSDFMSRIQDAKPLAGAQLVTSGEKPVLILTLHHALYDGISIGMLYHHLALRYNGSESPHTTPFFEAARTIARNAGSAVKFWADQIQGYAGLPASADANASVCLSEATITQNVAELEEQCRQADFDIKDVCISAFGKALACVHGRTDAVFGQVIAARHSLSGDEWDVVGPMFNTVPYRIAIKDKFMTNRDVVDHVHTISSGSIEYQHASLAEVQKIWRSSVSDSSAELIDSIFVYSKVDRVSSAAASVFGDSLEADKSPIPSEYRINFEVEHTSGRIVARVLSSTPKEEMERLLEHFKNAVLDIIEQPTRFATAYPEELRDLSSEVAPATLSPEAFDESAVKEYAEPIRAAMAEVTQVSAGSIRLNSSIYSFGVDSIAAIQIVAHCRKAGVRLSVADILKGAMLGRICEIVAAKNAKSKEKQAPKQHRDMVSPMERQAALLTLGTSEDKVEDIIPCLPGQEYHLISWLQSGRTLYEPEWIYKASCKLDVNRLKAAWKTLRERNEVLRTTFVATAAQRAVQVIMKAHVIHDEAFAAVQESRALLDAVKDRARIEARNPSNFFDLPVRLRLIEAPDGDAVMLYVHHSLYDAWSMPRLVSELAAIYNNSELEAAASFAQLVRYNFETIDESEEAKFWQETLAGCEQALVPSSSAPTDALDRSQSFAMVSCHEVKVADLEQACSVHDVSPHQVVLVAFARALARITNTSSPLFGFFQLGRSAAFDDIDKVTGPCVNTLPLGLRLVRQKNVLDCVRELQQILSSCVPFEQSSLRTAVKAFDPTADQLPFNAYINLLWNKSSLGGVAPGSDDLFSPMALGVPTDYTSSKALPGTTAVDALDIGLLPPHQLFLDVGPGDEGVVVFGARADAALMDEEGIRKFIGLVEEQLLQCIEVLRS